MVNTASCADCFSGVGAAATPPRDLRSRCAILAYMPAPRRGMDRFETLLTRHFVPAVAVLVIVPAAVFTAAVGWRSAPPR